MISLSTLDNVLLLQPLPIAQESRLWKIVSKETL